MPKEVEAVAEERILEVLKEEGWKAGEGMVFEALLGALPLRLVRRVLKRLKAARRRRIAAARVARRFSFKALAGGVMWCLDETQLAARRGQRVPIHVQLIRDPATRMTSATKPSPPVTAEAAIAWVEQEVEATGVWPLVISTDNGPGFKAKLFEDFLEDHEVVHLVNLPHTPEHNCHAERGVKELKGVLGIPRGRLAAAAKGLGERVEAACSYLNQGFRRDVLDGLTAAEEAVRLPTAETLVNRSELFEETRTAIAEAVQGCMSARARRLAERKASSETLARYNLITITRGGKDAAGLNTDKTR